MTITGSNFGSNSSLVNVTINDAPCSLLLLTADTQIECSIDAGVGANLDVIVAIDDLSTAAKLSYQGMPKF